MGSCAPDSGAHGNVRMLPEFDASKIVAGSITADKITTGQYWDNYPKQPGGPDAEVSDENVWENYRDIREFQRENGLEPDGIIGSKTQAMIQELSDYNVRMNDWIMKMASEPEPPPDRSWITFREERR